MDILSLDFYAFSKDFCDLTLYVKGYAQIAL